MSICFHIERLDKGFTQQNFSFLLEPVKYESNDKDQVETGIDRDQTHLQRQEDDKHKNQITTTIQKFFKDRMNMIMLNFLDALKE